MRTTNRQFTKRSKLASEVLLLLAVPIIFLWMRRFYIFNLRALNPDEADLLAAGKRAVDSLVPFRSYSTTTYGPVWPTFLGLLGKLGVPLTLPVAHLIAALFASAITVLLHICYRRRLSLIAALSATGCLTFLWSNGGSPFNMDFVYMSSELLPVLLLVGGIALYLHSHDHRWGLYFALVLLGLAPLAKYQIGPISLTAACLIIWRYEHLRGSSSLLNTFGAYFAPTFFFALSSLLAGTFGRIVDESIPVLIGYLGPDGTGFEKTSLPFAWFLVSQYFVFIPTFVAISLISIRLRQAHSFKDTVINFSWPFGIMVISVFSVGATRNYFPHYLQLFLAMGAVLTMEASLEREDEKVVINTEYRRGELNSGFFVLTCLLFVSFFGTLSRAFPDSELVSRADRADPSLLLTPQSGLLEGVRNASDGISKLCPPRSTVVVWGYAPDLYSLYGFKPGSRFTFTVRQINDGPNRSIYRDRLRDEIVSKLPECVIEAVGPAFFYYNTSASEIAQVMPDLHSFLQQKYSQHLVPLGDPASPVQLVKVWDLRKPDKPWID
jgi:hypothetical protein